MKSNINDEFKDSYYVIGMADIDKDYYEDQLFFDRELLLTVILPENYKDYKDLKIVFRDDVVDGKITKEYDYEKILNMLIKAKERLVLKGKQE